MRAKTAQSRGKAARTKGAAGEREIIRLLKSRWPDLPLRRDLRQYQSGGLTDIVGIPGYTIEVKRRKKVMQAEVDHWWAGLVSKADGVEPVLAYRQDQQDWRFRLLGIGNFWIETDFDGFCETIKGDIDHGQTTS
jgi:Holliday junction resolvase